jgi:hypothetical protein
MQSRAVMRSTTLAAGDWPGNPVPLDLAYAQKSKRGGIPMDAQVLSATALSIDSLGGRAYPSTPFQPSRGRTLFSSGNRKPGRWTCKSED